MPTACAATLELSPSLVRRHHERMLGVAGRFTANRALAEEIVQETWEAVLTGLVGFEGRSTLERWMYTILTNRSRTRARREARTVPMSSIAEPSIDPLDTARFDDRVAWGRAWSSETPEAVAHRRELVDRVGEAIDALPRRQREVLLLRDVRNVEASEVCRQLGVSEGNQRVLLHRARAAVREALGELASAGA
ncbi:MAG: sigma-70 family RNA polymerase sigma factor [Alphaproteobacteria bacterium]|nr:sigma-70 family RNA polymerase sigma factor [Alphaproteobacteria bacterium]MCB9695716.1 sigma-70 family RNA polymerase sigma factor [Alphaproteobacteria bacterium]